MTVFATLSLLSMPVNYRGGAETAHAHGLFQFWIPGGHAEVDYQNHHHGSASNQAQQRNERTAGTKLDASPDTPVALNMGAPVEKSSGIAVAMLLSVLAMLAAGRLHFIVGSQPLRGRLPIPELPPPRTLLRVHT